jgi:hypothetical protein
MFPSRRVTIPLRVSSTDMAPKKSTRTQLCITAIHENDDTLQAVELTAKRTIPIVLPDAKIDDDDDDHLYNHL